MIFGLVGVFVLLPRWQEQRQSSLADGEAVEAEQSPDSPTPTAPEPEVIADSTISEPNPIPPPSDAGTTASTEGSGQLPGRMMT